MNRNRFSRREFIGIGALPAGASLGLRPSCLIPTRSGPCRKPWHPAIGVRFG